MLSTQQIELVRRMCARPASGSPIVLGIWGEDTNRNLDKIMEGIKHERYGALAAGALDDKSIAVITDFWPEHENHWIHSLGKWRFRNQLIFILHPDRRYSERFLNRIALINHFLPEI